MSSAPRGGSAVFIGDNYVKGDGAPNRRGVSQLTAFSLGLTPIVSADAGSGYTQAGRRGFTTEGLVGEAPDLLGAQLVVLASGHNDTLGSPPDTSEFRSAAKSAISAATTKWPRAKVVVVGPWTPGRSTTVNQRAANEALRDVATELRVAFVDTVTNPRLVTEELIGSDKVNPTPSGHEVIARELARRIAAAHV